MTKTAFFKIQFKRFLKIYPTILLVSLISVAIMVLSAGIVLKTKTAEKQKIRIGIVGDVNQTHLGIGIYALQNLDSSRFSVEFVNMDEQQAKTALEAKNISGYVYIPRNFIASIVNGENKPAQYVMRTSPAGISNILVKEITVTVSDIVTISQNAVYAMQDAAEALGATDSLYDKITEFNLKYITSVLSRESAYSLNFTGVSDSLSFTAYYVCALILFFLLMWGICCSKFFLPKNDALFRVLYTRKITVKNQVISVYAVYLIYTFVTLGVLLGVGGAMISALGADIGELRGVGAAQGIGFAIKILPVIFMITAMHMFLYELVVGQVSAILLQFLLSVSQAYLAGCFYPNYFFPETVRQFASFLPAGAAMKFIQNCMTGVSDTNNILLICSYSGLFIALAVVLRKISMAGEKS